MADGTAARGPAVNVRGLHSRVAAMSRTMVYHHRAGAQQGSPGLHDEVVRGSRHEAHDAGQLMSEIGRPVRRSASCAKGGPRRARLRGRGVALPPSFGRWRRCRRRSGVRRGLAKSRGGGVVYELLGQRFPGPSRTGASHCRELLHARPCTYVREDVPSSPCMLWRRGKLPGCGSRRRSSSECSE